MIISKKERIDKIKESWKKAEKNCPSCNASIKSNAKRCVTCNRRLGFVGILHESQAPLSVIIALLSIFTVMYEKIESSRFFSPPASDISISPIEWESNAFHGIIVNEGDRPGWVDSSNLIVEIETGHNKIVTLEWPLSSSLEIIQPSSKNNLMQIQFFPVNISMPRTISSNEASYIDYISTLTKIRLDITLGRISRNFQSEQEKNSGGRNTYETEETSTLTPEDSTPTFDDVLNAHKQFISSTISKAIINRENIVSCAVNTRIKNYNGTIKTLTQDMLYDKKHGQPDLYINDTRISTSSTRCIAILESSLMELSTEDYYNAIEEYLFRTFDQSGE